MSEFHSCFFQKDQKLDEILLPRSEYVKKKRTEEADRMKRTGEVT
jgi:hypothetical protein